MKTRVTLEFATPEEAAVFLGSVGGGIAKNSPSLAATPPASPPASPPAAAPPPASPPAAAPPPASPPAAAPPAPSGAPSSTDVAAALQGCADRLGPAAAKERMQQYGWKKVADIPAEHYQFAIDLFNQ